MPVTCVQAKTLYTGRRVLRDAWVCFNGATLTGVYDSPRGERLGSYAVIVPALIDAHSHIGLHRSGEPGDEQEANDAMDTILPLADALDSVQMDDSAFRDAVEEGVLYSCVLPGSGNLIGGRSAVIRNYGQTTEDALVARAGIKAALGYNPMSVRSWKGTRPHTRMGTLSLLRAKLDETRRAMEKHRKAKGKAKADNVPSAEAKVFESLLLGKDRLRVHCHKSDDLAALCRILDEFPMRVTVEHTMDVHDADTYRSLAKRGIPVIYGPVDTLAYKVELKHESTKNIRFLLESGVEFGLMTDHPCVLERNLMTQLRWFLRAGLSKQAAVELVTRKNAELLGLDKQLGTLEKGRWASFAAWTGDPFDLESRPAAVYGEGRRLFGND